MPKHEEEDGKIEILARRETALILAPCNLGLKPLWPGHVPGAWRAPQALCRAGLIEAVRPRMFRQLPRPRYSTRPQPGTRIRNGQALRKYNLQLAKAVSEAVDDGLFPIIVGGDCSILPGALAGLRSSEHLSLIHIDGHSDFRHPGNFDFGRELGAAAGMDVALATGRGEPLLTEWPGCDVPLVHDHRVVQIGERESRDLDFAWPDIVGTGIHRFDIFDIAHLTGSAIAELALERLKPEPGRIWIHVDLDVIDGRFLPAVDCPGSPGLQFDQLEELVSALAIHPGCVGATVTIYDPDLDPGLEHARRIVRLIAAALAGNRPAGQPEHSRFRPPR